MKMTRRMVIRWSFSKVLELKIRIRRQAIYGGDPTVGYMVLRAVPYRATSNIMALTKNRFRRWVRGFGGIIQALRNTKCSPKEAEIRMA